MSSNLEILNRIEMNIRSATRPVVIMLIGIPGSGKSTFRASLLEKFETNGFQILSTDDFLDIRAEKLKIPYDEAFSQYAEVATENFFSGVNSFSKDKINCIIDRTNTTFNGRAKVLAPFNENDYYTIGVVFNPDFAIIEQRIKDRHEKTGKFISEEVLHTMRNRFEYPDKTEFTLLLEVK